MLKLLIFGCAIAAIVYGITSCLDQTKAELYQQAALRCAMRPEGLNCDQFNTAAGGDE